MLSQIKPPPPLENLLKTEPEKLRRLRHTCAHILAMAVQKLFPETKVTIGPTTDTGFYYDFDRKEPFTPEEDLEQINLEMKRLIKANLPVIREEVNREQIRGEIQQLNEPYKWEILDKIPATEPITRYFIGSPDMGRTNHPEVEPSLISPAVIPPKNFGGIYVPDRT
ncbi:hypothetical protein [[Phormidium] sp. ETS-05]|uniref:hypothetical protein n=1 Tax=[Phormidium] sp. ETS-05 TaxID=222819 RepID=UPI0035C905C6